MFYKIVNNNDLIKYSNLNILKGNVLISNTQKIYSKELNILIDSNNATELNNMFSLDNISKNYDNIYYKLHNNIRSRVKLIYLNNDEILKLKNNHKLIRLGLSTSGRDSLKFNLDEKLILKLCGHIALFDIYNLRDNNGFIYRQNLNVEKKNNIIDDYLYDQEVLKVMIEDNFLEVSDDYIKLNIDKFDINKC